MICFGTWLVAALSMAGGAAAAETPLERGKYLVEGILTCGNCHTPRVQGGALDTARLHAGGPQSWETSEYKVKGANITPDRETGIGDDTRGLVELLAVLRAMDANALSTVGDVLFVGTVGEEELGDLRGVKALFRDHPDIDGFISLDGDRIGRIVNRATGSHRYEAIFKGPGGHSFGAFGLPSAIHAMGRAIAKISEVRTPSSPKTTFTVGIVRGCTSVNAIAGDARMGIDMRSDSMDELLKLEKTILAHVRDAAAEENRRWNADGITVELKLIGDRPAGRTPEDSKIVHVARRSLRALGQQATLDSASTDSNLAMSLGIPAVTISHGGDHQALHSLNESYKPTDAWLGPQNALLVVLGLAGLDGVSPPLLEARKPGSSR